MIEVVFSDSTKGGMAMAAKSHHAIGRPVAIGFNLDVGDISGEVDGGERKAVFVRLFNSVAFKPSEIEHFFGVQKDDVKTLITAAKNGEPIRVWESDAAYSMCGFAYVCDLLREMDCPLSAVHLPKFWPLVENTVQSFSSWQEVSEDGFLSFLSEERPVSRLEKWSLADAWRLIRAENTLLRASVSGRLISVPENFYDFIIERELPEGEIVMARLIGQILGRYPLGVSDGWYAMRMENMIDDSRLLVVGEKDPTHPYGKVLRKREVRVQEEK